MTTLDDLHQFILLIANKNGVGYLAPQQRNRAVNHAELQLFKDRYGPPEKYQPGRPVPPVAYPVTQKVEDDLNPFLTVASFVPTTQAPHWTKPAGLLHLVGEGVRATYQPGRGWDDPVGLPLPPVRPCDVTVLTQAQLAKRLANTLHPPTAADPVATLTATQLELYPAGALRSVTIPYLRKPVFSEWVGMTPAGASRLVYDPVNSTPTEFPVDTWNDLAMRALAYLGIHLSAPQVAQFAELKNQQG